MRETGGASPGGQDEFLQRLQIAVEALDRGLEPLDVRVAHRVVARDRQLAAQIEQIVLHIGQAVGDRWRQILGAEHAQVRIELVDRTDGVDARRILGHARTVAQPRRSGIAGPSDDFR